MRKKTPNNLNKGWAEQLHYSQITQSNLLSVYLGLRFSYGEKRHCYTRVPDEHEHVLDEHEHVLDVNRLIKGVFVIVPESGTIIELESADGRSESDHIMIAIKPAIDIHVSLFRVRVITRRAGAVHGGVPKQLTLSRNSSGMRPTACDVQRFSSFEIFFNAFSFNQEKQKITNTDFEEKLGVGPAATQSGITFLSVSVVRVGATQTDG
ncbi:hypothetical protein EVAR_12333_1 [Eumeta japonica]|uniref:Uncharacterized protein n=1 Tax=Eumeta variegata TaxID=151549 RepID=A0A4C1X306_EUMVA|nr:hypothetical protein EVAR_12333_1 [Eumeta japonica]